MDAPSSAPGAATLARDAIRITRRELPGVTAIVTPRSHLRRPGTRVMDGPPVVAAPLLVSKFHIPEIVFGPGSLGEAGHAARRLGARRVFVVTDPGIIEAGWVAALHRELRDVALPHVTWHGITPNPKDHEIVRGYDRYRTLDCDVVIGIGGGSAMDAAKAIAVLASGGGDILDYEGVDKVAKPILPVVMVPTTAGTGADVSQFCVITDTNRQIKATLLSRALVPNISLTDPRVLTTMPQWLTAATGIDALTHAIEAYVSRAANRLTDLHALSAVRLVSENLLRTVVAPRDLEARCQMAQASLQAGMAFTNSLLGATHALSHPLGGLLDLPHGVVNGVILPHVIRFNAEAAPERYIPIAKALGAATTRLSPHEAAHAAADRVRSLADDLGIPRRLSDLAVPADAIPSLAAAAMKDSCIATNPRPVTAGDLSGILRDAL
jgi:alcohol dehydrogenase class IV